ncbi:MAG TPA: FAD binding domain-containing protein [Vineibacter sp.]|nr:FAD binding domain-containing protein [Vineibacter sp.]
MTLFRLIDAQSAAHAVRLLAEHGPAARPIAAGGDLLDLLKEGVTGALLPAPDVLINLGTAGMAGVSRSGATLRLGAMTTLADLAVDANVQAVAPMLVAAIGRVASPQLRNVTTLAGNLLQRPRCLYFRHLLIDCFKKGGHGCPAAAGDARLSRAMFATGPCCAVHPSDLAPVLVALDATLEVVGPSGSRTVRMDDVYAGAERNPNTEAAVAAGEIVAAVLIAPAAFSGQAFEKFTVRGANDFADASVAVAVALTDGVIRDCRVVVGAAALRPVRCREAEALAIGHPAAQIVPAEIADAAVSGARVSDTTGRIDVLRTLVARTLARAIAA